MRRFLLALTRAWTSFLPTPAHCAGSVASRTIRFTAGLLLVGCRTEHPSPFVTYRQEISNATAHKVSLRLYRRAGKQLLGVVPIAPQQGALLEYKQEDAFTPFYEQGRPDSVAIIFDDKYVLANRQCSYGEVNCPPGRNILWVSDYQSTDLGKSGINYKYVINENDFKLAK